jgi:tetratricopeptide (TPR) repeat protein
MATREEIITLISYVLGEKNRQLLIGSGLDALPKECKIAALRGLQDLGWVGHSGLADFAESYSLTKEGRRIAAERPPVTELEPSTRDHIDALRIVDGETNCAQKEGLKKLVGLECDMGNWDTALIHCYQLRRLAERTKDTQNLAFSFFNQGKVEVAQNRWDEALESYLNANERFMEAGDRRGVAMTNRAMGVIYANKGDHSSATRCFESSLSMARMICDRDLEAKAEDNLANIFDLEGKFDEAEKAHTRSLEYFLEVNDLASAARTSNNLGVLNMLRDRYQVAAEYFEKTIDSCRQTMNRSTLGISLINCAYCSARCGDIARSITYTDEAVSIFKEPNDINMLALAYRNYGYIELRNSRYDLAFEWFEKSVRAAEASGVEDTFAACCHEYGMGLIKAATDLKLAKKLLKKAASLYRSMGDIERARTVETKLSLA